MAASPSAPARRPSSAAPAACAASSTTGTPSSRSAGIGCRGYYRTPVHRQVAMERWNTGPELPVTEELARTHLALPMSPVLGAEQAGEVTAAVRAVLG